MKVSKLRYAAAVDLCGSVTAAAAMLNVTQSSVTKSVADVERDLGYSLFNRHARGLTATEGGRAFLDRAQRLLSDFDQLIEDAKTQRNKRDIVLRVGVAPPSIEGLLNRAVMHLFRTYPNYRIQMRTSSVELAMQLLRHGDIDICIGPEDKLMANGDTRVTPLGKLRSQFFVRKAHPLASVPNPAGTQIGAYPVILPDLHGGHLDHILQLLTNEQGPPSRQIHILENFPMVAQIVATTDAVGIVSEGYAQATNFLKRFTALNF
jgi:DNA-binding transcriptional LysR family regulator